MEKGCARAEVGIIPGCVRPIADAPPMSWQPRYFTRLPMQYRNFCVRRKICPSEIAGDESV